MTQQRSNRAARRQTKSPLPTEIPSEIAITVVKSNFCRVIHADGAWGSITGHGNIYMALFSEHSKTPDSSRLVFDQKARTGQQVMEQGPPTYIREIEAEIILSPNTARALRDWLDARIKQTEAPGATIEFAISDKGLETQP